MVILFDFLDELSDDQAILNYLLLVFQNKVLPIKTTKNIQLLVLKVVGKNRSRANAFVSFLLSNIFEKHEQRQNWHRLFAQSNFYLFSFLIRSKAINSKAIAKTLIIMMSKLLNQL